MKKSEKDLVLSHLKSLNEKYDDFETNCSLECVMAYITHDGWNPIKYRPMTEEEVRETEERWGIKLTIDERVCFDCSMPEDDQEILVCTSWGHIFLDRCELDPDDGYALEENGDWDGIVAWMPLPEPYTEE